MLTRREASAAIAATALTIGAGGPLRAEDVAGRPLPPPRASGGMPLIDALKLRRSTRAYSERSLEAQTPPKARGLRGCAQADRLRRAGSGRSRPS